MIVYILIACTNCMNTIKSQLNTDDHNDHTQKTHSNTGKGGRRTRRSTRRKTTTPTNSTTNTRSSEHELAFALNDIGLGSALEQILCDDQWMDDASGVIPHCLAILRTCHSLTERLAELASIRPIGNNKGTMSYDAAQATARLIEATKRVPSRVDDVVRSMHPPFDVRLLEARLAALVLAVSQVALLTQSVAIPPNNSVVISARGAAVGQWIDEALNDMHAHLLVLRHISEQQTADEQSGNSRVYTSCSEV